MSDNFNRQAIKDIWRQKAFDAIKMGQVLSADEEMEIILEAAWNTRYIPEINIDGIHKKPVE